MFLRKCAAVLTAVVFASSAALAFQAASPNATGTWSGTMTFKDAAASGKVDSAYMVLKQEGTTLTGTAGPSETRQFPIEKVKMTGTKAAPAFTFSVTAGPLVLAFDLKLVDGKLKGTAVGEKDGDRRTVDVELKLVK